jgi:hypothetical protein
MASTYDFVNQGFSTNLNASGGPIPIARASDIEGGFRVFKTLESLNNATGSDPNSSERTDMLIDSQIVFVSASDAFYRINRKSLTTFECDLSITDVFSCEEQEALFEGDDGFEITYEEIQLGGSTDLTALNNHTGSINTFTSSIQSSVDTQEDRIDQLVDFTGSFTDQVGDQVRITIDAIPSESIFNFRENGSDLFGTKATGSITVDAGFGTNDKDTFFIDCQTDFVVRIQNFTNTTQFNSSVPNLYNIGGVYNAQSTEQFLLTASAIINDNDDLGTINISGIEVAPDNAPIAGFLSSSVSGNTINFVAKHIGTFANNIRVAFTGSDVANSDAYLVPSSQVKQLGGGNNHNSNDVIANGTSIGNIAVLDISGSNDSNASLKRMDLLSFLDETSVLNINSKIDTLISQSNSRYYATNASKLDVGDGNGIIGSADLLAFLAAYGQKANGSALPAPGTGTVPGERVAGSDTREGLREVGGVTDQQDSVLTNGTFTIANQSSGSLNIEGTDLISLPAKINFTDKIGGDPGNSGSGAFQSSGSLLFHSESIGSFEFNRPLDIQGNLNSSGELIGIINGGSF